MPRADSSIRPIQKFAQAAAKCTAEVRIPSHISSYDIISLYSYTNNPHNCEAWADLVKQGAAYGNCIVVDYHNVYKDKCLTEFLRLKECYLVCFACSINR